MTKQDAIDALMLIRDQLDNLSLDDATEPNDALANAYRIVYELWNELDN